MWGMALVLAGILVAGFGVRLALEAPRPRNLIGMLLAPLGLCVALVGVGRLLSPGFFGREARGHRALRIMPAGDLAMLDSPAGSKDRGGYRGPLWARLAGRGVDFVGATRGGPFAIDRDHEGFEGLTVDGLAAHLEADLPACAPDVILLYAGSVDLAAGAAPEVVVGRLSALIDATISRAPRARLLVAALVGAAGIDPARVAAVNQALRQAVLDRAARGERVRLVDLAARVGKSELAADGVHLTERGYERVAEVWLEALGTQYPSGFEAAEVP